MPSVVMDGRQKYFVRPGVITELMPPPNEVNGESFVKIPSNFHLQSVPPALLFYSFVRNLSKTKGKQNITVLPDQNAL